MTFGGGGSGPKNRYVRPTDQPTPVQGGGGQTLSSEAGQATPTLPAVPTPPAPTGLIVGTPWVVYSTTGSMSAVNVTWRPPPGPTPESYDVEWALDSGFTSPVRRTVSLGHVGAAIDGMPVSPPAPQPQTPAYFRVRARVQGNPGLWSSSVSISLPRDDQPPAAPTDFGYSWSGRTGDLTITWTNPTSQNFRRVRVRIYTSNGGILLHTGYSASGRYTWLLSDHHAETSGVYDPSVYVVLTALSWNEVPSATDLTGTATLSPPATPAGLTTSWASDDGTAAADLLITWTSDPNVARYQLTIDGVPRVVVGGHYLYTFTQNVDEHSGTPEPDLPIALVAVDALGQTSSSPAATTATNAAPPATTISGVLAGTSTVGLTIGPSAARDLKDYRVRVYKSAVLVDTIYVPNAQPVIGIEDGTGSYTFDVSPRDLFDQVATASSQTSAVNLIDWSEFVANLRSGATYSDSLGTTAATLAAALSDNGTGSAITYPIGTTWHVTTMERPEAERVKTLTLAFDTTVGAFYVSTSTDGSTWAYFAGPLTSSRILTQVANEAAAQSAAVATTTALTRFELPAIRTIRFMRIHHRRTTGGPGNYGLTEYYWRRLVQSDDIEAEAVTALNIAANTITGDRLIATAIDGFTITGATVRSGSGSTRIEFNSTQFDVINSGVTRVRLDTTGLKTYDNSGVVQVEATTGTDGALTAGAGAVRMDYNGIQIYGYASGGIWGGGDPPNVAASQIQFLDPLDASVDGAIQMASFLDALNPVKPYTLLLQSPVVMLRAYGGWGNHSWIAVNNSGGSTSYADGGGGGTVPLGVAIKGNTIRLIGTTEISGGLNVGEASGAAEGQLLLQRATATTNTSQRLVELVHRSTGTTAAQFGAGVAFRLEDSGGTIRDAVQLVGNWRVNSGGTRRGQFAILCYDEAGVQTALLASSQASAPMIGFLGASPTARPTVTGTRTGTLEQLQTVVANILTALATLGLVTDSTS